MSFSPLYSIGFARCLAFYNVKPLGQTGKDMERVKSLRLMISSQFVGIPIKYVGIIRKLFSYLDFVYVLEMIWSNMFLKTYLT